MKRYCIFLTVFVLTISLFTGCGCTPGGGEGTIPPTRNTMPTVPETNVPATTPSEAATTAPETMPSESGMAGENGGSGMNGNGGSGMGGESGSSGMAGNGGSGMSGEETTGEGAARSRRMR